MLLIRHIEPISVIKLDPDGPIPSIPHSSDLWTIARTRDELSLVCATKSTPLAGVLSHEDGWCAFRVAGTMEFTLTGIIARISDPIARAGLGIFVVSTFDTDYILIKDHDARAAIEAWRGHGIDVTDPLVETARLLLVDLDEEVRQIANKSRDNRVWVEDYPTEGDVLIARLALEVTESLQENPPSKFQIRLRSTGEAIGGIGFKADHNSDDLIGTEIGYGIAQSQQGKGFGTEAVAGIIKLAHQRGIISLLAETDPDNFASQKVLLNNGFSELTKSEQGIWWTRSL